MGPVIVCGLGHVGYRIVGLLRRLGEPVSAISLATRAEWERWAEAQGVHLIRGDARDLPLLEQAGLEEARAVILATDRDAANVEIGLDVRARRPGIPIVLRLFDQTLAQHLEASFGFRAFGMSAVAAPTFAAAALGEQVLGSFAAADRRYVIRRIAILPGSRLAGRRAAVAATRYGLAALAHEPSAGDGVVAPLPDQELEVGDQLTAAGLPGDWDALEDAEPWTSSAQASRRAASQLSARVSASLGFARGLWNMWRAAPQPLRTALLALNTLIAMSVAVFYFAMGLTGVDALYFVITTVTTTGYGDISPRDAPDALKLYAALVMILGSLTLATLYSLITDFIVTRRFREMLGGREVPDGGHTVVVGLGNVGYRVAGALEVEGPVVVVERDPSTEFVEVTRRHTPLVLGDGRMSDTLRRAGVDRASALVAVTGDDATNLAIGLSARELNPEARLVVRLFDADFASKVRQSMGFQAVLSGSAIAAPTFVAAALCPDAVGAIEFQGWLLIVRRCGAGPEWAGQTPDGVRQQGRIAALMVRGAGERDFVVAREDRVLSLGDEVLALTWRPLVGSSVRGR